MAKDLPAKLEQTIFCELEPAQLKLYDELRQHYRTSLLDRIAREGINKAKIEVLEALLRLRQAACHPGLIDKAKSGESSAKLEALLDQCQPGWRAEVVDRRYAPNMIVSNALVRADRDGYRGRPRAAVPEVPGLFLAGDWVGPTGMLADASFASAREAARSALEAMAVETERSLAGAVR